MGNILNIEGHRTGIINLNTQLALDLKAIYQGTEYPLASFTAPSPQAMIFHFLHKDKQFIDNRLNVILLMTNGSGKYRSTGLIRYEGDNKKMQFYSLGDDLKINLSPSADIAIRELPQRLTLDQVLN